jgi:RND family efflux transporter MFP subunit
MKKVIVGTLMFGLVLGLWGCGPKVPIVEKTEALAVKVMTVVESALEKRLIFNGSVLADKEVSIVPNLSGKVLKRLVNVGSVVKKDQVLLVLDSENVDRSVEQSKRAYELARVNYASAKERYEDAVLNLERNKELYDSGALSQSQYEQIEAAAKPFAVDSARLQLDQSKLAYESAQSTSEGASVKAPFDGVISVFTPQEGSTIAPGQPIGSMVDVSQLKLTFEVTEKLISQINFDTPIHVSIPSLGTEAIPAKITAIAPVAGQASKMFPIEISFENVDLAIKPGMFATVEVDLQKDGTLVLVPYDAVLYDENGYYVYVVEKDLAVKRPVVLGDDNGIDIELKSGVKVGEALIIKGQSFVKVDSVLNIVRGE